MAGRSAQRAREGRGPMRALRRAIRSLSAAAVGRPRARRRARHRTLQGFARHPDGQQEDLFPGSPPILFPGAPPDPVLREGRVSVARQGRSRDCGYPRGADRDPEAGVGVQALRRGQSEPAPDGSPGHAEQPGVERVLSVQERRHRAGERGALPEDPERSRRRAPRACAGPLAFDPVLAAAPRRPDSAAHGRGEYAPHLPSAAYRPGPVQLSRRQRHASAARR